MSLQTPATANGNGNEASIEASDAIATADSTESALAAVARRGRAAFSTLGPSLRSDPGVVLALVSQDGEALSLCAPCWRDHRPTVLAAVQQCGLALRCASPAMRGDK